MDSAKGHSAIAHFSEQSMQRGLVGYRAGQQRVAVVFKRDREAVKPVGPLISQMALDPDLIGQWLTQINFRIDVVCHYPVHLLDPKRACLRNGVHAETRKCCSGCCFYERPRSRARATAS